jgi:hypothetical protein
MCHGTMPRRLLEHGDVLEQVAIGIRKNTDATGIQANTIGTPVGRPSKSSGVTPTPQRGRSSEHIGEVYAVGGCSQIEIVGVVANTYP